jgi:mono/diheme cytochrome c family protein
MRLLAVGAMFSAFVAALAGFWLRSYNQPGSPRELFEVRCSTCHASPDLQGYTTREKRGIVMTMLRERGADKVISNDEAAQIIGYITGAEVGPKNKEQGDGDT